MRAIFVLAAAVSAAATLSSHAAAPPVFTKPFLGFNAWFAFDTSLNETLIRAQADAMVSLGLRDLGYQYINLDGGWQGGRDAGGKVVGNTTKFPSGMKALGDYIHSKGLLYGMYTDRGGKTCDGAVGSAGHEADDVATYAEFGADFVKSDSCSATQSHAGALAQYSLMATAMAAAARPMAFSLCGWLKWYGAGARAVGGVGTSWRIGPDALSWNNVLMNLDAAADTAPFVGINNFADVDEVMGPSRKRPINRVQVGDATRQTSVCLGGYV